MFGTYAVTHYCTIQSRAHADLVSGVNAYLKCLFKINSVIISKWNFAFIKVKPTKYSIVHNSLYCLHCLCVHCELFTLLKTFYIT